jgi:SAM-dependent methyltransferase
MADLTDIRETVRDRYAAAATAAAAKAATGSTTTAGDSGCCISDRVLLSPADETGSFGAPLYDDADSAGVPQGALNASLGCGVPTAVADLHAGETVLDLGSGAGADVLISARRVGPTGKAIGLDMTDEMLDLARSHAAAAGVENAEFVKGYLEAIPLSVASVDVVISNCVLSLCADKATVIREAARVLRPGGRFAISDVIAEDDMDEATRADMAAWTGCLAAALTEAEYRGALHGAGLAEIEIRETHRVHQHAIAAIIRARKPDSSACCDADTLASCCEPSAKDDCCHPEPAGEAPSSCGCTD